MLRTIRGPVIGLVAQVLLLDRSRGVGGLGSAALVAGAACAVTVDGLLALGLLRDRSERLGPAGWVTLARATLAVGVAALTVDSFEHDTPVATLVALSTAALVLDFVDGRVARRTGTASGLGARFDGEVDAFLILALVRVRRPDRRRMGAADRRRALRVPRRRLAARVDARDRCRRANGARWSRRPRASR